MASSLLEDNTLRGRAELAAFPGRTDPGLLALTVGAVSMGALLPGDLGAVPDEEA
jgi:hypothetical protein